MSAHRAPVRSDCSVYMGQQESAHSSCSTRRGQQTNIHQTSLKCIEWMWKCNPDPWLKSEPDKWSHFSDVENLIIEEAFTNKQTRALLDGYCIDFQDNMQVSNADSNKQRPVKRMVRKREDKDLREACFVDLPVSSGRSFGGQYGWVSPFVIEVRRDLGLEPEEVPSKKPDMIPMLVEKAARGIIEEGKYLQKQKEAEHLANMLKAKKNEAMEEVWKCCAYLYSLESFLYKTLNATMRLVGDKEHEQVWRSKIRTLGPFCLLLWDDPLNKKLTMKKTLYRGADLKSEQIVKYEDLAKNSNEYRSLQAFTSCSRNRQKAEEFGNTLFIMEILFAFIADLSPISEYTAEEEELITPGVCFRVKSVKFDRKTNKHLIHLELWQRFSVSHKEDTSNMSNPTATSDLCDNDADLRGLAALLNDNDENTRDNAATLLGLNKSDVDLNALREAVGDAVTTLYDRHGY
ncbi:unnamed protein product [Rotaria magnacalcarata]|nr:unnamed protein product [Rotaria magnacalcarata]CAF2155151.1 unnamed protein product [Rotaria magnacalcarata]CAF3837959.1 unnamed protein product [Rotaria magnacalcarata]CAF3837975.1 unnamed protein product [Rotaria magnacalcarata]